MAQDAVIREEDCKTENGVIVEEIVESGNITSPLTERILGRLLMILKMKIVKLLYPQEK